MKRKKIWIALIALVIIALATAYYKLNKPVSDVSDLEPDFKMTPQELLGAYETNEVQADSLYLGKIIEMTGTVSNVDTAGSTISLETGSMMSVISCEISEDYKQKLSTISAGDNVEVKGECAGFLMDVVLKRGSVEAK